jgi:hypothetical protein
VAAAPYPCSYELIRDGAIVSTGHITLDSPPVVGEAIDLGGERLEIESVWPAGGGQSRVRLVPTVR